MFIWTHSPKDVFKNNGQQHPSYIVYFKPSKNGYVMCDEGCPPNQMHYMQWKLQWKRCQ
jgi:hypothetical protein